MEAVRRAIMKNAIQVSDVDLGTLLFVRSDAADDPTIEFIAVNGLHDRSGNSMKDYVCTASGTYHHTIQRGLEFNVPRQTSHEVLSVMFGFGAFGMVRSH